MGPEQLVFMIPLTAIVLGIGSGIVKMILNSLERRLQWKLQLQQQTADISDQQLEALRAEMVRLRDTCTQYDVSLQNSLERLEQRVTFIESRSTGSLVPPSTDPMPPVQTVQPVIRQVVGQ